jgi:hypothetical protein
MEYIPRKWTATLCYVTEHKIRPVTTQEKIVVGGHVPADVELESVPADWGPSLTKYRYVYSGDRVMLVDPGSRTGSGSRLTFSREAGPWRRRFALGRQPFTVWRARRAVRERSRKGSRSARPEEYLPAPTHR